MGVLLELLLEIFGELILQLIGEVLFELGLRSRRRGQRPVLDRFAYGYLFALAMALVRLRFGA